MMRIALQSLFADRSKLASALAGVAFAALLVLVQMGLYAGFLETSSSVIGHMGGDVWVMPRGTEVLDSVETLSPASRSAFASHACVKRARPLVFNWAFVRKAGGTRDNVRVVGIERPGSDVPIVPWELAEGLPSDMSAPGRVAVESFDLQKLQITSNPRGAHLEVGGETVRVAAVTRGVRSFTLLPFVFAEIGQARRMTGMSEGETNYWVLDLNDASCAADVIRKVNEHPELTAMARADFQKQTQDYWIVGSGIGGVLSFAAMLGLLVGVVVVGQTLYAMVRDHRRELATLKALGATRREIVGFVAWQAAFLALAGTAIGAALALGLQQMAAAGGLMIVLAPWVVVVGVGSVLAMCAAASLLGVRSVLKLEAAEVFK
jgi:putative ABC transport system permease protein